MKKKNCGYPESFQVNNLREIKQLVVTYAMLLKIMEAKMWPIFQDLRIRHINIALINESWHQSLNVQCIYNQIYFTGMTSIPLQPVENTITILVWCFPCICITAVFGCYPVELLVSFLFLRWVKHRSFFFSLFISRACNCVMPRTLPLN